MVASTSRTTRSGSRVRPATRAAGTPPASSHTRALVRARAFSTRRSLAGVSSSRARHTVGGDATDPSTSSWWRRVSMSPIASPPPASMVATSTRTWPRSCPGTKPRLVNAPESSDVRPTWSASSRTAAPPACATTPTPSPETDRPVDHDVLFTYQVPSRTGLCVFATTSIPLQDRHFGTSRGRVTHSPMKSRG